MKIEIQKTTTFLDTVATLGDIYQQIGQLTLDQLQGKFRIHLCVEQIDEQKPDERPWRIYTFLFRVDGDERQADINARDRETALHTLKQYNPTATAIALLKVK